MSDVEKPFSPGLAGVIGAETAVSLVDGANGRLLYRGYPIEEVVSKGSYAAVLDLLLTGEWHPNATLEPVRVPPAVMAALRLLPAHAHPMDALRTAISVWGAGERLGWPPTADEARRIAAMAPSALAAFARLRQGLEPIDPEPGLDIAAAFLQQLHGTVPDPGTARALDAYLMAGAEHGLNASTFAARVIVATRADIASAVCGAIGALKGPLHGGAPAEVIGQLDEIGSIDRADAWARGKLARKELIMGFGHRVYRAYDPRAAALRKVAEAMPARPAWLELAIGAEEAILKVLAELKPDRPLKTNVEFYAAAVLQGVGLVPDLFPATFGLARIAGWSAHVIEQAAVDKIIRPDARYIGPAERHLP
jgi:citrate synthase